MNETAWICITAIAITAIVALALSFKNHVPVQEGVAGMTYEYDEQNRLHSVQPMNNNFVKLVSAGDKF